MAKAELLAYTELIDLHRTFIFNIVDCSIFAFITDLLTQETEFPQNTSVRVLSPLKTSLC